MCPRRWRRRWSTVDVDDDLRRFGRLTSEVRVAALTFDDDLTVDDELAGWLFGRLCQLLTHHPAPRPHASGRPLWLRLVQSDAQLGAAPPLRRLADLR